MKKYNRPEILIVDINVEDILSVSVQGEFVDWNNAQSGNIDDLWGK